jgi:hypothetical protein
MTWYGRQIQQNFDDVMRRSAATIHEIVTQFTPKDTGRARSNWNVGVNRVDDSANLEGPFRSESETIADGKAVIARAKQGDEIHITNALPYIDRLNRGWSHRAPAGFVERAVRVGRQVAVESKLIEGLRKGSDAG